MVGRHPPEGRLRRHVGTQGRRSLLLAGAGREYKQQCRRHVCRLKNKGKPGERWAGVASPGGGPHHQEITWRTEEVEPATEVTRRHLSCPPRPREEQLRQMEGGKGWPRVPKQQAGPTAGKCLVGATEGTGGSSAWTGLVSFQSVSKSHPWVAQRTAGEASSLPPVTTRRPASIGHPCIPG